MCLLKISVARSKTRRCDNLNLQLHIVSKTAAGFVSASLREKVWITLTHVMLDFFLPKAGFLVFFQMLAREQSLYPAGASEIHSY